ncbi:MAG TPA: 16S rRNA (adenine(1518)-N(6)/adenine(1519)-N(6))-dimethyltransferase RsmA [Bacteroidales bacterium]|nr:16S rRNA (adenine(1518)-N(6)/adenine(1519)-N(6))-dimethyltransferase RsmA [Bacteroidales bacterium]
MIKAKKYLGQHFLADKNIAGKIADSLINENALPVLEIGPGTGVLTEKLICKNFNLSLIEIDIESVEYLRKNYDNKFRLIHADFLKTDISKILENEFCVVGNLPYNISSQIFFKILEEKHRIPEVVCMIQKEVAERMASSHGNKTYGILSVIIQLFYKIEYLFTVNENVFIPPPKVKSGVIRLTRYRDHIEGINEKQLLKVVKTAFNQRRKTIRNSLKSILPEKFDFNNHYLSLRPEQLSPEDFVKLTELIYK